MEMVWVGRVWEEERRWFLELRGHFESESWGYPPRWSVS